MGLMMMAELVLKDVAQTPLQQPLMYYLECTRKFVDKDVRILLSMDKGDNLISFEPPFATGVYGLADGWVYDAPLPEDPSRMEGMYMSWAMKYIITLQKQIQVTGFGLVFNQHCTGQSRYAKAPYLAKIFRELLGTIAEAKFQGSHQLCDQRQGCRCHE